MATLVAIQGAPGATVETRVLLPVAVCSWHRRHVAALLDGPRGRAAIALKLRGTGKLALDWSRVRIEFARVQ